MALSVCPWLVCKSRNSVGPRVSFLSSQSVPCAEIPKTPPAGASKACSQQTSHTYLWPTWLSLIINLVFSRKHHILLSLLALTAPSSKPIALTRTSSVTRVTASFVLFQGHFGVWTKRKGFFYSPWQLLSHSEDRRRIIHQTEDMKSRRSRSKSFFFLSRCECPPTMWMELDLFPTEVQHSVLETLPELRLQQFPLLAPSPYLRSSWEGGEQGTDTAAMSVMRMLSSSSFSQHLVKTAVFYHSLPSAQLSWGDFSSTQHWQHLMPSWHFDATGMGRIPDTSKIQPELWVIRQGLAGIWARQAPCKCKQDGELAWGALCQALTLQEGLALRGPLQILLQVL